MHNKSHLKVTAACLDGIVRDMINGNRSVEQRVDNIVSLIAIKAEEYDYSNGEVFTACAKYVSRELKRITRDDPVGLWQSGLAMVHDSLMMLARPNG